MQEALTIAGKPFTLAVSSIPGLTVTGAAAAFLLERHPTNAASASRATVSVEPGLRSGQALRSGRRRPVAVACRSPCLALALRQR